MVVSRRILIFRCLQALGFSKFNISHATGEWQR